MVTAGGKDQMERQTVAVWKVSQGRAWMTQEEQDARRTEVRKCSGTRLSIWYWSHIPGRAPAFFF